MNTDVENIAVSGFALFVGLSIGLIGHSVNIGVIVAMGLTAALLFMLTETAKKTSESNSSSGGN